MRYVLFALFLTVPSAVAAPDFDKEIAPLLVKRCAGCHSGADPKGELDITKKAALLGGTMPQIRPGKLGESPLWQRVEADEMPPKKPLSAKEKQLLKQWIEGGAKWGIDPINTRPSTADWWAFQKLTTPIVPKNQHPVDHFIEAQLKARKLQPVEAADRRTLIRRLYFDVIGLPPTPEQVARFINDPRPDASSHLVDELLASPHYGERWARHWLDVVHYGETHGYDKDQPRPNAWPYRDYVIRSFNQDKPYARFVQEQIAGDKLYPNTTDGLVALGFLSAGPWDLIGHAEVPESKIDGQVARHLDRDDFVANTFSTFLSLTVHCAQCHDHKFDPISQQEYYGLQAVFAAIDRTERTYDADPAAHAKRQMLRLRQAELEAELQHLLAIARQLAGAKLQQLERAIAQAERPPTARPAEHGYHSAIVAQKDLPKWVQIDLGQPRELRQIVLHACWDDFNQIGAGFGFPVRYRVEGATEASFREPVLLFDGMTKDQANPGLTPVAIAVNGKTVRHLRITATKLAARLPTDFIFALAEVEAISPTGQNLALGQPVTALDSIEAPIRWAKKNLTDGRFPQNPSTAKERDEQQRQLDQLITSALNPDQVQRRVKILAELQQLRQEQSQLPAPGRAYVGAIHTGSGTFAGTGKEGGKPRTIRLLPRGDVTKPGAEVAPGSLSALAIPFDLKNPRDEGERRAAMSKWLTHPENPLLWRSIANRVWQYHFGRGLVDSPNDFGRMGELPTHPQLLDYLAAYLRDQGGSLKQLHRLILTSAAYRRASTNTPENAQFDADNRFYWRQNRRKLEAEAVRDSLLSVAGKLRLEMGGPSFQDFVIEKPEHSPHYQYHLYDPEDAKGHRRAIYRFIVRSKQQPFLATLDCADPSFSVEKRNQTLTPQQALTLLNNRLAVVMARHFAARITAMAPDLREQLEAGFQLAIGREATKKELEILTQHAQQHGLENACRVILNLNEFVFVD